MKKILLVVLSVMVAGTVVWAASVGVVNHKGSGDTVSFADFNSVIDSMRGLFNTTDFSGKSLNAKHHIGINIESIDKSSSLIIKDLIVVKPVAGGLRPGCVTELEGSIFAEADGAKHLWGCNGKDWVQLDTGVPVCGNVYVNFKCQSNGWENAGYTSGNNCPSPYMPGHVSLWNEVICSKQNPQVVDCKENYDPGDLS